MDAKKISFGFSKINKRPNLLASKQPAKEVNQLELIKCLEGKEIKLVEEKPEEALLVIPMKESGKTSSALLSLMKRRAVLMGQEEEETEAQLPETQQRLQTKRTADVTAAAGKDQTHESLEIRAARELLAELKPDIDMEQNSTLVLPVVKPDDLPLDGAKESTLNDYDSVPIQQFGFAMLRGMGWVEPPKKKEGPPADETVFVRPKGMGLGADKALRARPLLVPPAANEVLEIKKQAYVRILGGKHKDLYGQIEGFDDHAGRVIVKMAIGGNKEAFNEFLCQPVAKKEYAEYGKCINTAKFEEYKKLENEHGQIISKQAAKEVKHIKQENVSPDARTRYKSEREYKIDQIDRKPKREDQPYFVKQHEEKQQTCTRPPHKNAREKDSRTVARRSRSRERDVCKALSGSGKSRSDRHKRHHAPSDRSTTSEDSDSSNERHQRHKSHVTKKCKVEKKGKRQRRRRHSSTSTTSSSASSVSGKGHRRHKSHKKKRTKKNKKKRSR